MDEGDVFYALHGETRDSFKEGQPVEARVRYIDTESGRFAKLDILPNEVEGLLLAQHAAEGCGSLLDLQRAGKLALGMTVRARVRSVGYADADAGARRFEVGLTMLPRDLADNDAWERRYCVGEARADDGGHGGHGGGGGGGGVVREPCYVTDKEAAAAGMRPAGAAGRGGAGAGGAGAGGERPRAAAATLEQRKAALPRRPIDHPLWRHELWSEAVERMKALPPGAATFRPVAGPERNLKVNLTVSPAGGAPLVF